jgi:hypothetical protein
MLALIYLGLAVYLGDHLCRRFYRFVSLPHRLAAAFLVGLLTSSWFTYLAAWAFAGTSKPLLWANILYVAAWATAIFLLRRWSRQPRQGAGFIEPRAPGSERWDWIILGIYLVAACWLMFATFGSKGGNLQIADLVWTDFAPHTALVQSFAFGHNFPTEYPYFASEPIRYHFLFFFQAGNLEFLGLNLVWSLNLLSSFSLACMLALVMALGQLLFNSRTVGRIGSALFFFHGTLNLIPFLRSQTSFSGALHAIFHLREFLPSGYPYRGETWGLWTQSVFVNQRHLTSAIGILLVVLIFLVDRYRQKQRDSELGQPVGTPSTGKSDDGEEGHAGLVAEPQPTVRFAKVTRIFNEIVVVDGSFVFSGFLLGALPFWNALVFTSAVGVLFFLFLLFPCRRYMVGLAVAAAAVALPQILYLRSGGVKTPTHSLLHWGYVIEHPTVAKVTEYLGFAFGLKWPLIIFSLIFISWFHRRFFIAICSLLILTFFFRFSVETSANHKFLNLWLILTNLFAAHGLWQLAHIKTTAGAIVGRIAVGVLTLLIVTAGIIDLFPIHNSHYIATGHENDQLEKWVLSETSPDEIFLSDTFLYHPILLAGRKIFYGYTLFAWSAGYDLPKREKIYREMFESRNPLRVFRLLRENGVSYVAFDNGVRRGRLIKRPNEQIYAEYFPKVFEDKENKYGSLIIYKVPDTAPPQFSTFPDVPAISMFEGGKGTGHGQFDEPRGLAVDGSGNVLISDTRNGRIEKFSAAGVFLGTIAGHGSAEGELKEPNGLAIDKSGNIYVADTGNHRVQKLKPDGSFIAQWKGPEPGFYGPRDIAIAPDNSIYIVDQGRTRIVKLDSNGNVLAVWGTAGAGDGQFSDHTAVAVDGKSNRVYVADPRSKRIQVFDSNGKFLWKWTVEEWQKNIWPFQDLVIDSRTDRLYASSVATNQVLVFDLAGRKLGALRPTPPDRLEGASAIALWDGKLYVLSTFANRVSQINVGTSP